MEQLWEDKIPAYIKRNLLMKTYLYKVDSKLFIAKIESFSKNLWGNYISYQKYFFKYWKETEIFNFTNLNNETIKIGPIIFVKVFLVK